MIKNSVFQHSYADMEAGKQSAREIVPLLVDVLGPRSVVDVGCGPGLWLSVFQDHGVETVLGIDGDWIRRDELQIPTDKFRSMDLTKPFAAAVRERFDLLLSLEVAEHLPPPGDAFLNELAILSDAVLFSAAVPGQGGQHHINEQWPDYWIELFSRIGFTAVDFVRPAIWRNDKVKWWYAQDIFFFCKNQVLEKNKRLRELAEETKTIPHSLIHPRLFAKQSERAQQRSVKHRFAEFCRKVGRKFRVQGS